MIRSWIDFTQPYLKNWVVFRCPSNRRNPYKLLDPPTGKYVADSSNPSYGFNYGYLAPIFDCDLAGHQMIAGTTYGFPVTLAQIEAPAATVLIVDVKNVGTDNVGYYDFGKSRESGGVGGQHADLHV